VGLGIATVILSDDATTKAYFVFIGSVVLLVSALANTPYREVRANAFNAAVVAAFVWTNACALVNIIHAESEGTEQQVDEEGEVIIEAQSGQIEYILAVYFVFLGPWVFLSYHLGRIFYTRRERTARRKSSKNAEDIMLLGESSRSLSKIAVSEPSQSRGSMRGLPRWKSNKKKKEKRESLEMTLRPAQSSPVSGRNSFGSMPT